MKILKKRQNFSKFQAAFQKWRAAFQWLIGLKKFFPQSEVYLVGGAIRDITLNRPTKDFDFVVRGLEADKLEEFLASLGRVNLVGRSFGVFKFVPEGWDQHNPIDIALPRKEHAFGTGGYRDFDVYTDPKMSIEEDLSRRDFTINAMAIKFEIRNSLLRSNSAERQLEIRNIVDPYHGQKDLKNKTIRTVGRSEERFKEDYSRMLRAIRFACQLGFKIEKKTWQVIKRNIPHLNDIQRQVKMVGETTFTEPEVLENRVVPYEVIAKEFLKSFYFNPVLAFDFYDQSGGFSVLIPEILKMKNCPQPKNWHSEGDVWTHTRLALEKLFSSEFRKEFGSERPSIELIMAVLFHDIGKPYTIKTPEKDGTDRIRFNEHDIVGAKLVKEIAKRLKLSSPEELGVDPERLAWLVQHHMLLIQGNISEMRPTTIEKYFFNPNLPGDNLLKLAFVDILATVPENGQPNLTSYNQMKNRIRGLKELSANKKELPKPLLNGEEIMAAFNLKPGPKIGQLLTVLREEQLSERIKDKDGAIKFLKKHLAKN